MSEAVLGLLVARLRSPLAGIPAATLSNRSGTTD